MKNQVSTWPSCWSSVSRLGVAIGLAMLSLAVLFWGLRGVSPARADPNILYVDGVSGQDNIACGNSSTPCKTISYTLNNQASGGYTIRVAQGIYPENLTINISVTLEGGYEAVGWARNISLYETIIDGSNDGTVIVLIPGSNGTVLDGFTIRNGQTVEDGGGIYVIDTQITIQNCIVMENKAGDSGGGISVRWPNAKATIHNTQVYSNVASTYGGGIRVGNYAIAAVTNSKIVSNTAVDAGGGGIAIDNGGMVVLTSNQILSNTTNGWASAGILVTDDALTTIHSNEIAWNRGTGSGAGGIRVNAGSVVTITNNLIHGNEGGGGGGLAAAWYSIVGVYSNTIADNEAMLHGGGGIRLTDYVTATIDRNDIVHNGASSGSGIATDPTVALTVTNNLIASNYGPDGDGIIIWDGISLAETRLINNTIISNTADGVCVGGGNVLVRNNIFYGNGGAGICRYEPNAAVVSDHNAFWENARVSDVPLGPGDILVDPLFMDATNGDYHLQADSPCIDTGTNISAPLIDFEGDDRPFDGNLDGVATTDIGADEFKKYQIFLPLTQKNVGQ